jgi:purine-nucleoside phosphorylase
MAKSKYWKKLEASANAVQKYLGRETLPDTLIVLGSGFKGFEAKLTNARTLDLDEVPHMPVPRVEGHGAMLVVGEAGDKEVAVLTGRVHLYEGHAPDDVVYPLRVLSTLGIQNVLLSNASGSVDPAVRPGQVVVVKDHLNLTGRNCLLGEDAPELGPIFIDMSEAYDKAWRQEILKLGDVVEGVYAGVLGPNYETPAETAMLGKMGAHVVGMSTVLEVIAARHLSLRVACLSFVANMAGGLGEHLSHGEVLDLVAKNKPRLQDLLTKAVEIDL